MLTAYDRRVAEVELELLRREIHAKDRYLQRPNLEPERREAVRGIRDALRTEQDMLTLRLAGEGYTGPTPWLRALRDQWAEGMTAEERAEQGVAG